MSILLIIVLYSAETKLHFIVQKGSNLEHRLVWAPKNPGVESSSSDAETSDDLPKLLALFYNNTVS